MLRRATLALGLSLALSGSLAACKTDVQTDLTEAQANRIVLALHEESISAEKSRDEGRGDDGHYRVRVQSGDVARALSVLHADELPQEASPGIKEMFGEGSLVPTATEERARYVAAVGGELARSIESIDGVLVARVHVAVPEARDRLLDQEAPRPRASVLIKHRPGAKPLDDNAIRALVANAIEGMRAEDVAVVTVQGLTRPSGGGPALVSFGPISVTKSSAGALKAILGGAFGLHLLLAACLIVLMLRRQRPVPPVDHEPDPA